MNYRPERVSELIKRELGKIITKEIEFPPGAIFTITEVKVNKKLEFAKTKFSVFPSSFNKEVEKILERATKNLQYLLMKKINIKPMPKICFKIDYGQEAAAKVEKLLIESKKRLTSINKQDKQKS